MTKQTQFIVRLALLVGTLISLAFVPWLLVKAWILPLPDSLQQQADQAISHGLDGIIVYVDKAGRPPQMYAAGWHDRANKIAARPDALFKIASIDKLFTAVAITRLVNAQRLSLDGTLAQYFPELVGRIENADSITLRMLAQHRSGIPNYTNSPGFWVNPTQNYQAALDLILDQPANFAPDSDYEYCNTNYLLLGKLIEKTSGQDKFAFIQQHILTPLKLHHTYASIDDVDMSNLMGGYHVGVADNISATHYGSMVATAADVATFVRALNDGSVFEQGGQAIYSLLYEYQHGGWIPGYQSHAEYYKDSDMVIVQFNNTTDDELYLWNLSQIIMARMARIAQGD